MVERGNQGFTLVEVLIALAITVLVAGAAYSGISAVLSGAEQLRESGQRMVELNRAFSLLSRDLRFIVNRGVRDEFGTLQPALSGGPLAFYPLTLTRAGWHNGQELPRSDLQRVHYYLEDGALWRAYSPVLDRASDAPLQQIRLIEGVESIELRFLASAESLEADRSLVVDTRNWASNWIADPGSPAALVPPEAIEMRLLFEDLGEVRRFYVLPTAP
ncbi:MAG: type II secretion system minor pseudopilin GspJ [Congregibacter sp.]